MTDDLASGILIGGLAVGWVGLVMGIGQDPPPTRWVVAMTVGCTLAILGAAALLAAHVRIV